MTGYEEMVEATRVALREVEAMPDDAPHKAEVVALLSEAVEALEAPFEDEDAAQ